MRKEKYIKVKKYKGNTYFTVQFSYGDKWNKRTYSKTFNASDYDTPVQALNDACRHRDIKRAELLTTGLPTHKMTVAEAYEKSKEIYIRAEATDIKLDKYYNKYVAEKYGNMPVSEIDEWTITAHLESLRTTRTDTVITNVFNIWKRVCKTAKGMKAITVNPADTIESPKSTMHTSPRKQDFTDKEIEAVIESLLIPTPHEKRTYNRFICAEMIRIVRYTGLRPREIKGLTRDDIDFENNVIYIRPHGNNIKNRSSIRTIPMNNAVKNELFALLAISPYKLPFMFYGGLNADPDDLACIIREAAIKAGVKGFHLYGMRHSFDSELITNGVDPRTVMELMGHRNVTTTIATYARSTEEKRREAIEMVENGRKVA